MNYEKDLYYMQQIFSTIFSLSNKFQAKGDQAFGIITSRQMMAMVAIMHLPDGKATLNNIAKKLNTSRQSVKQLITIMEKKGYVVTMPMNQDKRALNVEITLSGKQTVMSCSQQILKLMANIFEQFSTNELEYLWTQLKKLYCFDGETNIGFEENIDYLEDGMDSEPITNAIKEFKSRRTHIHKKNHNNKKEDDNNESKK